MPDTDVSVIIPTCNRQASLRQTLASLARQALPADRFEVVVVDDGSTDATAEVAGEVFPFCLRYIRQANQGSAAARNAGARNARGSLLVFLDDDMLVEPDYLAALLAEHRAYARIVGMGTLYVCFPSDPTPFSLLYARTCSSPTQPADSVFVDFTDCTTNNLSIARDHFFQIGMMRDVAGDGPSWWADVEFGYRALGLGFRFRRAGRAVCYHRDYAVRDLATASARAENAAHLAHALFRIHPEVRSHLPMFADKTPVDWRVDPPRLVARKLARRAGGSRPALWLVEHAAHLLEQRFPAPTLLRPLYRWVVGGYILRGYRRGLRERQRSASANT